MALPSTTGDKITAALSLKEEGNALLKVGELKKAAIKYRTVFAYINGLIAPDGQYAQYAQKADVLNDEQISQVKSLKVAVYSNLSLVYMKLEKFDKALECAESVLSIEKENSKALFRKGQVFLRLRKFEESKACLMDVAKQNPQDKLVRAELELWKEQYGEWKKVQDLKAKEMFGGVL